MQRKVRCLLFIVTATLLTGGLAPAAFAQNASDIVQTAAGAGNFETLVAAVKAADLVDTLKGEGPFTVLAPTDEAFAALPAGTLETLLQPENKAQLAAILTYHVLLKRVTARDAYNVRSASTVNGQQIRIGFDGDVLRINDSRVLATDIECSNGVIHVIDRVLLPNQLTIPQAAREAGKFQTLLAALDAAELSEVLEQTGPFTVFAPTDEAFERLPQGTLDTLLQPENRNKLAEILKYHVVPGRVFVADAVRAGTAQSLQKQTVRFAVQADGPRVNDARLLQTDVDTANGVIHVIDAVLLPQPMSARDAMRMLQSAIAKGAPAYNHGDRRGCVRIYEQVCREILSEGGNSLPADVRSALDGSLRRAANIHHMGDRAWALRHGIDQAYTALRKADRMSTSVNR